MDRAGSEEEEGRTDVHSFALDGTATTYVASGTVDGVVADRWSMDEYDGVLRVAVGPSSATGDFNSILTLREDGMTSGRRSVTSTSSASTRRSSRCAGTTASP